MLRNTLAVLAVLAVAASTQAANITFEYTSEDTPNLPTHKTWTVKAISDQPMQGFDFAGDGSNDPATGRGFFGPMNQVVLFGGALSTVYSDNNPVIDSQPGMNQKMDSQFKVRTGDVVVPSGFAEEGPNILQGIWAHSAPVGTMFDIAQIVIPIAAQATVNFRGSISTLEGTAIVENAVNGVVGAGGVLPPVVTDATIGPVAITQPVNHTFAADQAITSWVLNSLLGPGGAQAAQAPTFSTATGAFSWTPQLADLGGNQSATWIATVSGTNANGTDQGTLTINVIIPEPATMSLVGLAMVGLVGFGLRKRS